MEKHRDKETNESIDKRDSEHVGTLNPEEEEIDSAAESGQEVSDSDVSETDESLEPVQEKELSESGGTGEEAQSDHQEEETENAEEHFSDEEAEMPADGLEENTETSVSEKKRHKISGKKLVLPVICVALAAALVFVSVDLSGTKQELASAVSNQKESTAKAGKAEADLKRAKKENQTLQSENNKLNDEVSDLNTKVSDLEDQNDSLSAKNDELENGAAAQLVEIKNAHEAGNWQETIDKYNKLHEKYNGSAEDQEAQALADDAQAQLDAEKQQKEAEEAQGYETGITYDQLARTPDDYEGKKVKFSGKVIQVIEGSDSTVQLRIAVNGDYDTVLFAIYSSDIVSSRVLEDDQITIYGTSVGTISYQSTMGGTITIPAVVVAKIDQ